MEKSIRVVAYTNQYFGQFGGEDKAGMAPHIAEGAVGPGEAINAALGDRGRVVATIICGDNYIAERLDEVSAEVAELMQRYRPDVVLAGPAYASGRLGLACGAVCAAAQELLQVPAFTAMSDENPGQEIYRKKVRILRTGTGSRSMAKDIKRMTDFALRVLAGEPIGTPAEEGYFPRGTKRNIPVATAAPRRALDMLLRKVAGQPFRTEVELPTFDTVEKAPPVPSLAEATVALLTDGGLVPRGNPDGVEYAAATKYASYPLLGMDELRCEDYDVIHRGYDTTFVKENPNRIVPLDVMRQLEREGVIGRVYDRYFVTTGVITSLSNSRRFGREIARELQNDGIQAALLTST